MALATTASQTTLTFSADATVEFKTTRVSPEPASPEPGSPLRTPMPGQSKQFFATPQQSRQRDDDLVSMSPITPGYGLDPTPRPPSKTRFAAALDATEEKPVATPQAQRPPQSPLDSLATRSPPASHARLARVVYIMYGFPRRVGSRVGSHDAPLSRIGLGECV